MKKKAIAHPGRSLLVLSIGVAAGASLTAERAAAQKLPSCHYKPGVHFRAQNGAGCVLAKDAPRTFTQKAGKKQAVFEAHSGGKIGVSGDHVLVNRNGKGVGVRVAGAASSYNGAGTLDIQATGEKGVGIRVEKSASFSHAGDVRIVTGGGGIGVDAAGKGSVEIRGNLDLQVGDGTGDNLDGLRAKRGASVVVHGNASIRVNGGSGPLVGARNNGVVAQGTAGGATVRLGGVTTIDVNGRDSRGASAFQAATSTVELAGDTAIRIRGMGARGLHANDGALIRSTAVMRIEHDGVDIIGSPSAAVYATSSALGGGRIELRDLAARTKGAAVHGVIANHRAGASGGRVNVSGHADIAVEGADAMAVAAMGPGAKVSIGSAVIRASGRGGIALDVSGNGSRIAIGAGNGRRSASSAAGTDGSIFGRRHAVSMHEGSGQSISVEGAALAAAEGAVMAAKASKSASLALNRAQAVAAAGQRLLSATAGSSLGFASRNSMLQGDVVASKDSTLNITLSEHSRLAGSVEGANLDIDPTSTWTMTGSSRIGTLRHAGRIAFQAPGEMFAPRTLAVGSLQGQGGGIGLHAVLGNSASPSDQVVLTGAATGRTTLLIRNAGGAGASTADGRGIRVVDAQGAGRTDEKSFALGAPVTAGPYEYLLQRGSAEDSNDWYLRSELAPGPQPGPPPGPGPAPAPVPKPRLYRPAVALYLMATPVYNQMGLGLMGRLHERVPTGGSDASSGAHGASGVWARAGRSSLLQSGRQRFGSDGRQAFVQLGKDLLRSRHGEGGSSQTGVMLTASRVDGQFEDRVRPRAGRAARAGDMRGAILALGGFHTRRFADGTYLDVVAQAERLDSRLRDAYGVRARTDGWGLGLSLEVGRPFDLGGGGWLLEPQAQLSWHRVDLASFEDGISRMDPQSSDLLRGRAGVRLVNDPGPARPRAPRLWLGADLLHEIQAGDAALRIDDHRIEEELATSWMEVGAGAEWPIAPHATLYGHLKYQRQAFGDEPLSGVSAAIGLRTQW